MLHRIHLLKLKERRRGHPDKPAPKIKPFVVVPKDTPTVYKPPSSVSSGTSFSSRKNDFKETTPLSEHTPSIAPRERIPISIPVHKPLSSNATSKRESFRVRPSLDRQSTGRASLMSRATLESAPVITRQKRRLEEISGPESYIPIHQDNMMEIDTQPTELQSVHSTLSQRDSVYSYNQSHHETSTFRSMISEEVHESIISREVGSSLENNTSNITIDDQLRRSISVQDEPTTSQLERRSSQHSNHPSPVASPSLSSIKSFHTRRSLSGQPSIASVAEKRRSSSVRSVTSSPVSQSGTQNSISNMDVAHDENVNLTQKKDTSSESEGSKMEEAILIEEDESDKSIISSHEKETLEIVNQDAHDRKTTVETDEKEVNVDMRNETIHNESTREEVGVEESTPQISVNIHMVDKSLFEPTNTMDSSSEKVSKSPIIEINIQNDPILEDRHEKDLYQNESRNEVLENEFNIDIEDDIDYNDYTMQEDDTQRDVQDEYLGEITNEEIISKAKDIANSMSTHVTRLVASKLGNLHIDSLHQLTTEAVRTIRNVNSDPYARSVIEDYVTKLSETYDKCHTDYNEYLKITNSQEKLEKLANTTRFEDAAIERERLQIKRKLEKSNKEIAALDKKINKLEELDDFWDNVRSLVNPK